jgi:hypothetical protein
VIQSSPGIPATLQTRKLAATLSKKKLAATLTRNPAAKQNEKQIKKKLKLKGISRHFSIGFEGLQPAHNLVLHLLKSLPIAFLEKDTPFLHQGERDIDDISQSPSYCE